MKEFKIFLTLAGIFVVAYFMPLGNPKITEAILDGFRLLQWYVRNHTLACVVPALFISGAITTFLAQASVMRYLGPKANKWVALTVGAVAGIILAVCSCSVLPMFAGIYQLGAGIGPACAFLYSGPAINVLAIFLSARVLGFDIGLARAIGSIGFAYIIGMLMMFFFRHEEKKKLEAAMNLPEPPPSPRPMWKTGLFFLAMVLFLIFSDWYNPSDSVVTLVNGTTMNANVKYTMKDTTTFQLYDSSWKATGETKTYPNSEIKEVKVLESWVTKVHDIKWVLAGVMFIFVTLMTWKWLSKEEIGQWMHATWEFTKMLVPLLFGGVLITGFISALLPEKQVAMLVGNNGFFANFFVSIIGMFFYFATLTEVPITQALMSLGMAKGPALALLLAGPALSLPSILAIRAIMGGKKTFIFCALVVIMSTITGMIFGRM